MATAISYAAAISRSHLAFAFATTWFRCQPYQSSHVCNCICNEKSRDRLKQNNEKKFCQTFHLFSRNRLQVDRIVLQEQWLRRPQQRRRWRRWQVSSEEIIYTYIRPMNARTRISTTEHFIIIIAASLRLRVCECARTHALQDHACLSHTRHVTDTQYII